MSIFLVVFILVFVGGIYGLFFASFFDTRSVVINAPDSIPVNEIEVMIDRWLNKKNYLISIKRNNSYLNPVSELQNEIIDKYPRIDFIATSRNDKHSFTMEITERKAVGIWCLTIKDVCYYYDLGGTAYLEVVPSSGFIFPIMYDHRDREIELGREVESNNWRQNILNTRNILQFGGIGAVSFSIPSKSYDQFNMKTSDGWDVYYSIDSNINNQTDAMFKFLRETITPDEKTLLEYVDLRINDRIYYKTIELEEEK